MCWVHLTRKWRSTVLFYEEIKVTFILTLDYWNLFKRNNYIVWRYVSLPYLIHNWPPGSHICPDILWYQFTHLIGLRFAHLAEFGYSKYLIVTLCPKDGDEDHHFRMLWWHFRQCWSCHGYLGSTMSHHKNHNKTKLPWYAAKHTKNVRLGIHAHEANMLVTTECT